MVETFKINIYFDEESEELETIISNYIITLLEKNNLKHSNSCEKQL